MNDYKEAIELIKRFEGIADGDHSTVNLDPYLCPAGYWTIGWGHVVLDAQGNNFKGKENKKVAYRIYPNGITLDVASMILEDDTRRFAVYVADKVKVPLTDNQFSALVSFCFNVGTGNFNRSSLLRLLNAKNYAAVPVELKKWNKGGGKVLPGLVKRRSAEAELWDRT